MDLTTISIIAGAAAAMIGSVAVIVKHFDTIAEVYDQRIKQPSEKRKREREDSSHQPIINRLEKIEIDNQLQRKETADALAEIKQSIEKQQRAQEKHNQERKEAQEKDRRIMRASAMALVSLYTDLHIKGEPNGKSDADIQRLRDLIYL